MGNDDLTERLTSEKKYDGDKESDFEGLHPQAPHRGRVLLVLGVRIGVLGLGLFKAEDSHGHRYKTT